MEHVLLCSEGENVDTRLEIVDRLTWNVGGMHLSFDLEDNITRIDYYDTQRDANIQRVEQKESRFFNSRQSYDTLRTLMPRNETPNYGALRPVEHVITHH